MRVSRLAGWLLPVLLVSAPASGADAVSGAFADRLLTLVGLVCEDGLDGDAAGAVFGTVVDAGSEPLSSGPAVVGRREWFSFGDGGYLVVRRHAPRGVPRGGDIEYGSAPGEPQFFVVFDNDCRVRAARRIDRRRDGAFAIVHLDARLQPAGREEPGNPPVPAGAAGAGVRVALVDSGVDYTLPEIADRLARSADGTSLGYDFWDMDARPFDANPARSVFFPQRHGTRTASILLAEAQHARLLPYRYPRVDMSRMSDLVARALRDGAAVVVMPLGGRDAGEWEAFRRAVIDTPQVLFVVSAGNDGRDIDSDPVYPAAFEAPNLVTVTSAGDFGRPAERVNWGRRSVDLMVPAERRPAVGFGGDPVRVSGYSYAVSRVAALAARIKAADPRLDGAGLKSALLSHSIPDPGGATAHGWIPDPLADTARVEVGEFRELQLEARDDTADHALDLDVLLVEESGWDEIAARSLVGAALEILAPCAIRPGRVGLRTLAVSDYLRDLSVGGARTLLQAVPRAAPAVVLVRGSEMETPFDAEAFGRGNTGSRPWLRDSVWVLADARDAEMALAHELFHVLSNSGRHVEDAGNLMAEETRPGAIHLTPDQCSTMRREARELGLLRRP